jgi:glycine C-acetyltransferase
MRPDKLFAIKLKQIKNDNLYIQLKEVDSAIDSKVKINGKWYLNFCSNNYLGLANNSAIKNAAKKAIDKYGIGPAAVRTISGNTLLHEKLELKLAKFKKTQSTITFQSGFVANLATIPAIVGENDFIFSDELNHASIIDGCRLSKASVVRYAHADSNDLEKKIKKTAGSGVKLIITDGVFSMDGDIAPLPALVKIVKKYNALLMVDDAHGEGVLGKNGRGIVDHFKLHGKVDIEIGTMSKAFGVIGGYVAASKLIVDWLRQRARPFLFSSAMTIPDVAACIKAVEILSSSDELVKRLWSNTNYFKKNIIKLGFDIGKSQTPIAPIMLGDEKLATNFSQKLFNCGIFAKAITYPTVGHGKARIRIMNSASHSRKDLDTTLEAFKKVGKSLKVI